MEVFGWCTHQLRIYLNLGHSSHFQASPLLVYMKWQIGVKWPRANSNSTIALYICRSAFFCSQGVWKNETKQIKMDTFEGSLQGLQRYFWSTLQNGDILRVPLGMVQLWATPIISNKDVIFASCVTSKTHTRVWERYYHCLEVWVNQIGLSCFF